MNKKSCPACVSLEKGFRSRIPFKHTCGLEPAAVKKVKEEIVPLTFEEIKNSALDDPRLTLRDKLELLPIENMYDFSRKLVEILKIDEDA